MDAKDIKTIVEIVKTVADAIGDIVEVINKNQ